MLVTEYSVQKEYEKNTIKPEDIQAIRRWIVEQDHLPSALITDLEITLAYYCCEGDIELTKRVIDLNFTLRTLFYFYSKRCVDNALEVACHTWLITPLIKRTIKGYRVIYCHLLDPDTKKFVYGDVVRAFVMLIDLLQYEEGTWPGVAVIVNMDNVTLGHVYGIDLTVAQQFFFFLQEAMFIRLKEFHFINAPSFMDKMLQILKPFLKSDMLQILKVHQANSKSLEQYLVRSALPKEAGGENKSCVELRDEVWRKLKDNVRFFEEETRKRVDESKRIGGRKSISTFFPSMVDSFKNLSVD